MKKRGKRGERELEASSSRAAAKKKKRKRPFRFKRLFLLSSLFFSLRELSHRVEQLGGLFQCRVGGGDFQRGGLDCEKGKRKRRGMSFRMGRATKRGRCSRLSLSGARSLSLTFHASLFLLISQLVTSYSLTMMSDRGMSGRVAACCECVGGISRRRYLSVEN